MTKKHKQLVLVAVLSITLFAVWPSGRKAEQDTADVAAAQASATAGPNSEVTSAKHSAAREYLGSDEMDDSFSSIETFRQRWSIDEILEMGPAERSPLKTFSSAEGDAIEANAMHTESIQAVYFNSSSSRTDASAIISGQIVKPGQSLRGNRIVGEIHQEGIAIESAD